MTLQASSLSLGVERSHRRVERICIDCGEVFEASYNRCGSLRGKPLRCSICQAEYKRRYAIERHRELASLRTHRSMIRVGGAYRIIRDPCQSWSPNGSLAFGELQQLAAMGYLDTGMQWSNGKHTWEVWGKSLHQIKD